MTCPHLPAAVGPCGQGRQGGQGAGKDKGAQAAAAQHGAVAFGKAGEGVTALFQHGETPGAVGGGHDKDTAPRTGTACEQRKRTETKKKRQPGLRVLYTPRQTAGKRQDGARRQREGGEQA